MDYDPEEAGIGHGKILEYSNSGTAGWIKVPGTVEFSFPEAELEAVESTNDDSEDRHKEYMPGLYEPGTVGFSYRYGKTAFAALEGVFQLGSVPATAPEATKFWRETLPDTSKMEFRGFITKHGMPVEIDGVMTVEGEMQVVGKRTFTPAA